MTARHLSPAPSPTTVSVRARGPLPVGCGGHAFGRTWVTLPADAPLLRELERKAADLAIVWPGEPPPQVAPLPAQEAAASAPPAPDPATASPTLPAPVAAPLGPAQAPPPLAAPAPAQQSPAPPKARPAPRPAPPPVEVVAYDPRHASLTHTLWGHALDALRERGHKPAPAEATDLGPGLTLESLLDRLSAAEAGMHMSRTQRALVRAVDGAGTAGPLARADVAIDPGNAAIAPLTPEEHHYHFGAWHPLDPVEKPPALVYLRSGIRSGKTYIAAIGVVKSALTCSMRRPLTSDEIAAGVKPDGPDGLVHALQQGESVRVVFVTPKAEQSKKAFDYVKGAVEAVPWLRKHVVKSTTEMLHLRRPSDGVLVEFVMLAASPRGNNIRSGWLAGAIFDEAAFFDDGDGAAVNLRDNLTAAISRLLPGAQVWLPSSPWSDEGHWHEEHTRAMTRQGQRGASVDLLAFHSSSRRLNPALPSGQEETVEDPLERAREYDAVPVSALSNLFFPQAVLARAINPARTAEAGTDTLQPLPGVYHYAGTDMGFRKNSSALVIGRNESRMVDGRMQDVTVVAYVEERIPPPKQPLVPGDVVRDFAATCTSYGAYSMRGDNSDTPTVREHLEQAAYGVDYDEFNPTMERNAANYTTARSRMANGLVEIPNIPRLVSQLKRVLCKRLPGGRVQVVLPKQGNAHGDIVAALVIMLAQAAEGGAVVGGYQHKWDSYMPRMDSDAL